MADKIYTRLKDELSGVKKDVLLKNFTTYKIGGPAKYFFISRKVDDLLRAIGVAGKLKIPLFILGGGSNLLISDKGFAGLVIKIENDNIEINKNRIVAGAGMNLTRLAYFAESKNLSGIEWATGIPGTLGGAIYGNAQAFGTKISDSVSEVEALDIKKLEVKRITNKQCRFSLKSSIFKKDKRLIIISSALDLKKDSKKNINKRIREFLDYRKTKHPIALPSAGSTFVNPVIKIKNKKLLAEFPELKEYNEKGVIPAGYMIAKCGLAGKRIGKAKISEQHANFIVNTGAAKAKEVLALINLARSKVKNKFGVSLETEVQFVGL